MRRPRISGFTLFEHPGNHQRQAGGGKGWQMSVRREGEAGWDVKIIPAEQAAMILSMLETSGHPDGPWMVSQGNLQEEVWYLTVALRQLTGTIDGMSVAP